jgi:hypothetical protein
MTVVRKASVVFALITLITSSVLFLGSIRPFLNPKNPLYDSKEKIIPIFLFMLLPALVLLAAAYANTSKRSKISLTAIGISGTLVLLVYGLLFFSGGVFYYYGSAGFFFAIPIIFSGLAMFSAFRKQT